MIVDVLNLSTAKIMTFVFLLPTKTCASGIDDLINVVRRANLLFFFSLLDKRPLSPYQYSEYEDFVRIVEIRDIKKTRGNY